MNNENKNEIIYQFSVDLPTRHNKGGQSQNRMARLNDQTRHNYIRKCCQNASKYFVSNNKVEIDGLVVLGSGSMKDKFCESNLLDARLKNMIVATVTIGKKYKDGWNDAIQISRSYIKEHCMNEESTILEKYFNVMNSKNDSNDNKYNYCYGIKDTLFLLKSKLIETLIVSKNVGMRLNVILINNKVNPCYTIQMFVTAAGATANINKKIENNGWCMTCKMSFIEWLNMNSKTFGIKKIEIVNDEGSEILNEFCHNYGGIGGLLQFGIDFIELTSIEEKENLNCQEIVNLENINKMVNGRFTIEDVGKTVWIIKNEAKKSKPKPNAKTTKKENNNNDKKSKCKGKNNNCKKNEKKKDKSLGKKKKESVSESIRRYQEFKKKKQEMEKRKNESNIDNVDCHMDDETVNRLLTKANVQLATFAA